MEIEKAPKKVVKKLTRKEMKKLFPMYTNQRSMGCKRTPCINKNCANLPGKDINTKENS